MIRFRRRLALAFAATALAAWPGAALAAFSWTYTADSKTLMGWTGEDEADTDFRASCKGGGHAAACLHELPTVQAEPLAVDVGQLENSPLDPLLRLALRRWKILAVRYELGGYRGCGRNRFSACDKTLFSFAQPTTHRRLPSSVAG